MGRDRLRRGCSLEVIFEEDSDFCSHLDSLDPIPHFRRANKSDSFSIDTLFSSELSTTYPLHLRGQLNANSGRNTSLDGLLDYRDMDSCFVEWDEFSGDSMRSDRMMSFSSQEHMSDSSPSGRRSRVSRRQIVEASWVMDEDQNFTESPTPVENFDDEEPVPGRQLRLGGRKYDFDFPEDSTALLTEETYAAIDQFDEQRQSLSISRLTTTGATTSTNKSSWNSSRDGSQKSGVDGDDGSLSSSHVNFHPENLQQMSKSLLVVNMDHVSSSTDVKRVRALFENSSASSSEDETNFSRKFNKGNNAGCKRLKENNSNSITSTNSGNTMRSAYSHLSLNQMERCDFADLLVNDKVIIEDSPDIFQMYRHRHRDNLGGGGFGSKVSLSASPFSRNSTLRRSKSVGAGIHQLNEDENMSTGMKNASSSTEDVNGKDRPCILAEEMPAPDTVKNVRTVFEQLYQKSRVNSQENSTTHPCPNLVNNNNNNKSLSSIRSNPTSKILRSESMRNDFITSRAASVSDTPLNTKPIILTTTLKKTQEISKVFESKIIAGTEKPQAYVVPMPMPTKPKTKPGISKVWPSVTAVNVSHRQQTPIDEVGEDENNSLSSATNNVDDSEDRKQISPDVLNRIRSCGTTTTYFGGEIVAKTVQNRKLHVTPRKNSRDEATFNDFEISSTEMTYPTDEIFFSARPNQAGSPGPDRFNTSSPSRRPFDLQFNSLITSSTASSTVDTAPRIISVLPKSQSNSPTKSNSPVGSLMEGRNSPEGCESQQELSHPEWINDPVPVVGVEESPETRKPEDNNNNSIKVEGNVAKSNKFSEAAEGAWF